MASSSKKEHVQLKADIREALRIWFRSLPAHTVESKCLCASGVQYSPSEILEAVENDTNLGQDFIAGLCAVQRRMRKKNPTASVVDLIQRSTLLGAHVGR